MSKPSIPGELRDVDVKYVSLVDKAANRRRFKIFKSVDWPEDNPENAKNDIEQQEQNEVQGFFQLLKDFFTKKQKADENLGQEKQVEKVGRKISAARLKTLKDAYSLLAQIIEEAESEEENKEGAELTKEELIKMVADTVEELTRPLNERLEQLEKQATAQDNGNGSNNSEELAMMIKGAVAEAIKPLEQRLETVEKARGISNRLPEEKEPIEKNSFWGGAFLG